MTLKLQQRTPSFFSKSIVPELVFIFISPYLTDRRKNRFFSFFERFFVLSTWEQVAHLLLGLGGGLWALGLGLAEAKATPAGPELDRRGEVGLFTPSVRLRADKGFISCSLDN